MEARNIHTLMSIHENPNQERQFLGNLGDGCYKVSALSSDEQSEVYPASSAGQWADYNDTNYEIGE